MNFLNRLAPVRGSVRLAARAAEHGLREDQRLAKHCLPLPSRYHPRDTDRLRRFRDKLRYNRELYNAKR